MHIITQTHYLWKMRDVPSQCFSFTHLFNCFFFLLVSIYDIYFTHDLVCPFVRGTKDRQEVTTDSIGRLAVKDNMLKLCLKFLWSTFFKKWSTEVPFGSNGYIYYLDYGPVTRGVYTYTPIKLYTLNTCRFYVCQLCFNKTFK